MTDDAIREIARIVDETAEADDALRRVVARVADEQGVEWAGIAFVEDGSLTVGPSAGAPDERRRTHIPVTYRGDPVGELLVDGSGDAAAFARVAELIAPLVLIGWDTGGGAWEP